MSVSRAGQMVLYTLNEAEIREIRQRRVAAGSATKSGNDPHEGQEYPALIVRDWAQLDMLPRYQAGEIHRGDGIPITEAEFWAGATVNLQVFLDGDHVYWATSRTVYQPGVHGEFTELGHDIFTGSLDEPESWPLDGGNDSARPTEDIQRLVGLKGSDVDGKYGPETSAYVANWQYINGLDPDGWWGPASDARGFEGASLIDALKASPKYWRASKAGHFTAL